MSRLNRLLLSVAIVALASFGIQQTEVGRAATAIGTSVIQAYTSLGTTPYHLPNGTGASDNSTSIKGSAGNLMSLAALNTTTVVYYLKLYNSSGAPTCSSATNLKHVFPIPPAATSGLVGGFVDPLSASGESYPSGIGFCVVAGGADTDDTNAGTGVFIEGSYK